MFFQRSISILAESIDKFEEEIQKYIDSQNSPVTMTEEYNDRVGGTKMLS